MEILQDIPAALIWIVLIVAIIFAVFMYFIINAEEVDEDAIMYYLNNKVKEETSADQELKK